MGLKIDLNVSANENLLALIKHSHLEVAVLQELQASDFTAGVPTTVVGENGVNTQITITATAESTTVSGEAVTTYRRLPVDVATGLTGQVVELEHNATLEDLKTEVLSRFKVSEEDVTLEGDLPAMGTTGQMAVVPVEGHLLFVGQTTITVTVKPQPKVDLADVLVDVLDGFDPA